MKRVECLWNRFIRSFAVVIATGFGAGFSPWAPGTVGTLVGVPLVYWTQTWSGFERLAFWSGLFIIGTWAAQVFDDLMKTRDHPRIVIDEIVGFGIAAWATGPLMRENLKNWITAFVFFRIFDIFKPQPIRYLDQWSHRPSLCSQEANKKNARRFWQGFGVMIDDLVAGVASLGIVLILQWFQILPAH